MLNEIKRYWRGFKRWAFGPSPSDAELSALVNSVIDTANIETLDKTKPKKPKKPGPHCCIVTFNDNGETWCSSKISDDDDCQTVRDKIETQYGRKASYQFLIDMTCKPKDCERTIP